MLHQLNHPPNQWQLGNRSLPRVRRQVQRQSQGEVGPNIGSVVSCTVTVWIAVTVTPMESVAVQVMVVVPASNNGVLDSYLLHKIKILYRLLKLVLII